MNKQLKTFLFIMKHGRMRLGLVKRLGEMAWINERIKCIFRNWDRKPDFRNPKLVYEVAYLSRRFPDMKNHLLFSFRFHESLLDIGEDAGGIYTIQESIASEFPPLPHPPKRPKRKFTDNKIGSKDLAEFADFMILEELTEEIERRFIEEFKRQLPFKKKPNPPLETLS